MKKNLSRPQPKEVITPAMIRDELNDLAEQLIAARHAPAAQRPRLTRNVQKQFTSLLKDLAR